MPYLTKLIAILCIAICCVFSLVPIQKTAAASNQKIKCDRNFQLVGNKWISTSYCEDAYIAKIGQSFGFKVSANSIRNNPSQKVKICRSLKHDTRISGICRYLWR